MNIFNIFFIITLIIWLFLVVRLIISMNKNNEDDMNKYNLMQLIAVVFLNIFNMLGKYLIK